MQYESRYYADISAIADHLRAIANFMGANEARSRRQEGAQIYLPVTRVEAYDILVLLGTLRGLMTHVPYEGGETPEVRENWLASLEAIHERLHPIVHGQATG